MEKLTITRVISGRSRGSSRPIIVDTASGKYFVKLRGAAQGSGALISEVIVAELAEALQLPVLPRNIAVLEADTQIDDKNDELADLLSASIGENLALPMLDKARDAKPKDLKRFTDGEKAAILWLDRLVMNPDRTDENPNVLYCGKKLYLIDHGAALRFQYDWARVSEQTPSEIGLTYRPHVFESMFDSKHWEYWDELFAQYITRPILEKAVAAVPDSFLRPLLSEPIADKFPESSEKIIQRRRAAYVAYLWKRLKSPRNFATQPAVHIA